MPLLGLEDWKATSRALVPWQELGESLGGQHLSGEDRFLEELEDSAASGQDEVVGMWEPGWSRHGVALLLF